MAHGQNARSSHRDWWGKRPYSGISVSRNHGMKFFKRLVHKIERKLGKKQASQID